ncbi:MAG: hypothetical protein U0930_02965 [Pirellulales bacterium]
MSMATFARTWATGQPVAERRGYKARAFHGLNGIGQNLHLARIPKLRANLALPRTEVE